MSIEKAKELCRKYAKAGEYYDEFIERRFVKMPCVAKKFVNQVAQEILDELDMPETIGSPEILETISEPGVNHQCKVVLR